LESVIKIKNRSIGKDFPPFIIPEIGINHEGDFDKAKQMIKDAFNVGAECVKFQCHVIDDEMIKNDVIPGNTKESIWEIMNRCSLTEEEEIKLKEYTEKFGMIYLSTPFSRKAADRLNEMNVDAFKIGSGECNNYPLVKHIASFGKPIIISTGMNDIQSISIAIKILKKLNLEFAIMHTTSIYPTPYDKVRLGALNDISKHFPETVIGLSDHSIGNYTCFGAIALGASILEKHFTSNKNWPGPDIPVSIDPIELKNLLIGSKAIHQSLKGEKKILLEEKSTINFAYACVVSIKEIKKGEILSQENIWVKRPGTGQILAIDFDKIMNKVAKSNIPKDTQLDWSMFE
jgi:sialic acid synthase SpsE